ncbi:MAG: formyltransferase family protein [Armatimonadota bacterium]|nr:hypothetical protein [Armatimonadota bacterium]MCX7777863.1 formyltransferase family protein [Armatimonadota bacterium]MDW8025947.1 formyltransferase family protein [Armatimonadota bacterium]
MPTGFDSKGKLRIGWFSTGRDDAARELLITALNSIRSGELKIEIAFVFCNREVGESEQSDKFIELVKSESLPLVMFSSAKFEPELRRQGLSGDEAALREWRQMYDEHVYKLIEPFGAKLSFLAGYMLILSDWMCERHTMLNLHPAIPGGPKGAWQDVIWQLIAERASVAGAQIHIVTPQLDEGPPVSFCKFSLRTDKFIPLWNRLEEELRCMSLDELRDAYGESYPLFAEIRRHELAREMPLIVLTLKMLADGVIEIRERDVFVSGEKCEGGLDLSEQVDAAVADVLKG